jgi:hypothetical protein
MRRVSNPTGKGGFGDRPQDQWRAKLRRGEVTSRCTATSKRSGERCRFPATKGYGVCYWHGARGGNGNCRTPTSKRNLANKEVKRARLWAAAEVAHRIAANEIHPEARKALKDYISKIHPADEGRTADARSVVRWRDDGRSLARSADSARAYSASTVACADARFNGCVRVAGVNGRVVAHSRLEILKNLAFFWMGLDTGVVVSSSV